MSDFFSKYSREARIYPTILGLMPFYLWQYFYLNNLLSFEVLAINVIGNISLSVVVLYLVSEFFIRYPSKLLEDRLFNKKLDFPTTKFLLFSDGEYTNNFKSAVREKINKDFSITLLNEKEESENGREARMRIKEAIGLIIGVVKDGHLVLKFNISYGFFRNLWGASFIGLVFSIVLICLSCNINFLILNFSIISFTVFMLYIAFGKHVIVYFGENYARKLIEEYYKS